MNFETFEPVTSWEPGRFRAGPTLRLYEVDPVDPPWTHRAEWSAPELLVPTPDGVREPQNRRARIVINIR